MEKTINLPRIKIRKELFIYIFFLFLLFLSKPPLKSLIDLERIKLIVIFVIVIISIFLFFERKVQKNWFRLDVIFILGFFIVHFQWPIMFAISGISPENISRVWVNSDYVNFGVWLSGLALTSWLIGYQFVKTEKVEFIKFPNFQSNKLLILSYTSFILFLLFAGGDFLSGGVYKGRGGSASGEGISVYIRLIFNSSILLWTVLEFISHAKKFDGNLIKWVLSLNKFYLLLAGTFVVLFLSIGDRGEPLALALLGLILLGTFVRPITFKEFILLFMSGALMMTLISLGRSESSGVGLFSEGFSKFELQSGYEFTLELANSVRTLYMALSNVPEYSNYFFGQLWIGDLLSPFPFAQSVLVSFSNIQPHELGSAKYITFLTFGLNPQSGEGTSLVADIYLNFGTFGVFFIMFVFGFVVKNIVNRARQKEDIKWIIIFGVLASLSFYMARSGLFVSIRPILWTLLFFFFLIKKKSHTF